VGAPAVALREWLEAAKIQEGLILQPVRKGGGVGESLLLSAIRDIVIERSNLARLEGEFKANSLRIAPPSNIRQTELFKLRHCI
jgi:hypothetical protein